MAEDGSKRMPSFLKGPPRMNQVSSPNCLPATLWRRMCVGFDVVFNDCYCNGPQLRLIVGSGTKGSTQRAHCKGMALGFLCLPKNVINIFVEILEGYPPRGAPRVLGHQLPPPPPKGPLPKEPMGAKGTQLYTSTRTTTLSTRVGVMESHTWVWLPANSREHRT